MAPSRVGLEDETRSYRCGSQLVFWIGSFVFCLLLARDAGARPLAEILPVVASCPDGIEQGRRLVLFDTGPAPKLLMQSETKLLGHAFELTDEIITAHNSYRLDHPDLRDPLITVDVAVDRNRAAAIDVEWLNTALAKLSSPARQRVRLRLVAKAKEICALPMPESALRNATGTWSQLASTLNFRDERKGPSADDVQISVAAALRWNEKSCGAGSAWACFQAGSFAAPARARALYRRSCDLGVADGCRLLSEFLLKGKPSEVRLGGEMLRKSCDAGDRVACRTWTEHLLQGSAAEKKLGVDRLRKSCESDEAEACEQLGEMTLYGQFVERNLARARSLLQRGCDQGASRACFLLKAPDFDSQ